MTQALCLPGRLTGEAIARIITKPRIKNLYGLRKPRITIADRNDPQSRKPPFLERVWLPAYAVLLRTVARQAEKEVWTSVSGLWGAVTLLDCADELEMREIAEECFSPEVDESRAVELAKQGLLRYVMGQRGQINKPVVDEALRIQLYYYPCWVYYFRRAFGKFDIKVFDASTGKGAGPKTKAEVINAMVNASKARG